MRYALVQNNVVVNIIEADAAFAASIAHEWQHVAHADGAGIGWGWDGSAFVAPAPTAPQAGIPTSCTPAQGLVALYAVKGITEADVNAAIAAIPDPVQRYTAQIGFQRATVWERGSATMQAMAVLLGLSDADLDALFVFAAGVLI